MSDPNISGQAYALMVWTPIVPGREQSLQDTLLAFHEGEASPLAKLGTTHFARWIVLRGLHYQGPPQQQDHLKNAYLLFVSNFDGDVDAYLSSLARTIPQEVDVIWSHCVGYPGSQNVPVFVSYLRKNQIDTTFFVSAYPEATVADVRDSLAIRAKLLDFAVEYQGADDAVLQAAFLDRFVEVS